MYAGSFAVQASFSFPREEVHAHRRHLAPEVEELQKLVQDGIEKGFLNYDEIATGLEEVELTKEQIEDFYTYLIDHNVELLEGETHKRPPHEPASPKRTRRCPSST